MRVSCRVALQVFEAAEASGIARADLVRPFGGDVAALSNTSNDMAWETFAALLDELGRLLDHDPTRLRAIGHNLVYVPTWTFLRRLARGLVPLRGIYRAGADWVAPSQFPHVSLDLRFEGPRTIHAIVRVPEPHASSEAMFLLFEGVLEEIPRLLGLPRATLLSSQISSRTHECRIELPRAETLVERTLRRARAIVRPTDLVDAFEEQRRDLTSALAAMQTASQEAHRLFEGLPDLVVVHRGGVVLWNNTTCGRVLGYDTNHPLVGRSLFDIVSPPFHELLRTRMGTPVDTALPELVEVELLTRGGEVRRAEVAPSREIVFGGSSARLVVARDIEERVRMRHRLAIADRMASIGLLAASVAHEVNNPLAYVLNNIEIASRELGPLGDDARTSREALAIALEGVARIRSIVHDLVMLSRVDDRAIGPVCLRDVVESTLALARADLARHAEIVYECEAVPQVRGSAARIGQIVLNLLVNAREAMSDTPGGKNELRIAIRAGRSSSDVPGGASTPETVIVEISDTGVGIAKEHVARIFEPFFTTKAAGRGTGLGLAVSQALVTELGGTLTYAPRSPRGSTFRVELVAAT